MQILLDYVDFVGLWSIQAILNHLVVLDLILSDFQFFFPRHGRVHRLEIVSEFFDPNIAAKQNQVVNVRRHVCPLSPIVDTSDALLGGPGPVYHVLGFASPLLLNMMSCLPR